ncbi:MAG: restriction endonuclease subunit S [Actinobacteria bacterium]|nr:restriction endonuclease subunit S [Actinomycetota bacterium]
MNVSWPEVPLGEILTERREVPPEAALFNGSIRIISKIGFDNGKIELRSDGNTRTGMILVRSGDLVVSGINAAKGAIAIYAEENVDPIAATIHYGAYIPDKTRIDIAFLWWLLRSRTFCELLLKYVPGGIKTELKAKRLLPIPIPLPALDEQRRIVARIEQLSIKVEEARTLRQEAEVEAKAVINAELERLSGEITIDGRLSDVLVSKLRNGWSAKCDNSGDGVPVLSLSAVTGFYYRETEFKRTSAPTLPSAHYWLRPGDLLITRSNTPELVGHAAIYRGTPWPCIYPDLMMRLEIDDIRADKHFVHRWLSSPVVRSYITSQAKGTSPTMRKINQETVMNIPFPSVLSVTDQQRIAAYLTDLQTKVDGLKHFQTETAAELDALIPSILDKAFKGEL